MLPNSSLQNECLNTHTHSPAIDSNVTMNFLRPEKDLNQRENFLTKFVLGAFHLNKNYDLPSNKESINFFHVPAQLGNINDATWFFSSTATGFLCFKIINSPSELEDHEI